MKLFIGTIIFIIAIYLLITKFYGPSYCEQFEGQEQNYTKILNIQMSKCQDNLLCKIGNIKNYNFHGYKTKKWDCIPQISRINILEK